MKHRPKLAQLSICSTGRGSFLCDPNTLVFLFHWTLGKPCVLEASHYQCPCKASSKLSLFPLDLLCSHWQMIFHPCLCVNASETALAATLFSRSSPGVGLFRQHNSPPHSCMNTSLTDEIFCKQFILQELFSCSNHF